MEFVNAFVRWFWDETPPVTRTYMIASCLVTFAIQLEIISPFQLYFNPKLIFGHHQYWRLVTAFLFYGQLNIHSFFQMAFTFRYCRMLEAEFYRNRTADFFYLFLVGGTLMNMLAYFVNLLFLGQTFAIMLVYIWSRRNPSVRMNLFGLLAFQAPYLPWVLLSMSVIIGGSTVVDIIGIIVGHFYYFFEDVFPNEPHGFRVLETPRFIKSAFQALGFDEPPFPEEERPERFGFIERPTDPGTDVPGPEDEDQSDEPTSSTNTTSVEDSPEARNETRPLQAPSNESSQHLRARIINSNRD